MLSPSQQAIDLLQKSKNILIALPESLNGDSLGSALALASVLKALGKKVEIVAQEALPEQLLFLTDPSRVKNKITPWRDFIINIDTSQNKISRLRYETLNQTLKIFLSTPQKIEERDIKLEPGTFYYDLIITLDAPDLESLGLIFEAHTELFFNKPILNIDHQAANEYFGEVNLVEPTAAACAEIVSRLIDGLGQVVNEETATALLTGLIVKTHSFQNSKTTPQALNLASLLITQGARQEKIIQHLFKTKPLNRLKLWGRLLGKLDHNEELKTAWLFVKPEDFTATNTTDKDLPFILEETMELLPQLNFCFIFWPDNSGLLWTMAQGRQPENLQKLTLELGGTIKNNRLLLQLANNDFVASRQVISGLLNFFK